MRKEPKEKIKPYHIILLSCLLASLMILNSNYVNNQKQAFKSKKQSEQYFSEMMNIRRLSGENSNTEEICSRAADDLIDYYKTGDLSKIDLDNEPIKCEDKDKSYMQTLIDIVREMAGDSSSENDDNSRLRNLGGSLDTNKLVDYLMRTIPFLIFLVFGVLSIFGWIVCCICCCCDCCCCCCCKKESCKVPCFIFTFVFYALSVALSIYGLSQSKKIFVGLANTECSILKFFGQVLNGEIKKERPRWAGIEEIKHLIDSLISEITDMRENTLERLDGGITSINNAKSTFHGCMEIARKKFFNGPDYTNYKDKYLKNYIGYGIEDFPLEDDYILDVVKNFGEQRTELDEQSNIVYTYTPVDSTLYKWNEEFLIVSRNASSYMSRARGGFNDIFSDDNFDDIISSLNSGKTNLDKLTKPFTDAEKEFGTLLGDYSGHIDKYGKMSVTIVFSVLMVINIALAVLMLLIYFFSSKACAGCCCMRCLFKFCTHILWNVLSLMIILSFIIGAILGLVGTIGGDMMSLVSYIMSEENFNSNTPLLLNKLGDAKRYIKRCIHRDGKIAEELGLDNSLDSFNDINTAELQINDAKSEFEELKRQCRTHDELLQKLRQEENVDGSTQLMPLQGKNSNRKVIKYDEILRKINDAVSGYIRWDAQSSNDDSCNSASLTQITNFKPKNCKPYEQTTGQSELFGKYANILKDIDIMVGHAIDQSSSADDSVINVINKLRDEYTDFLDAYTDELDLFLDNIHQITNLVRRYSGDNDLFSFLNGKFIGTNLKIILKYLKYSLGVDLYTVGVCLIVVGCSLALSVSSTIILIVIINIELKKNQDARNLANTGMVPEYQQNYPQQVISYNENKI